MTGNAELDSTLCRFYKCTGDKRGELELSLKAFVGNETPKATAAKNKVTVREGVNEMGMSDLDGKSGRKREEKSSRKKSTRTRHQFHQR